VIAAYNKTASEVIRAHDGFVAEYMGDGVLAYFGYPCAHEDDANPCSFWHAHDDLPLRRFQKASFALKFAGMYLFAERPS